MTEKNLLVTVTKYFEDNIFKNHIINAIQKNAKLKSYKINPILVKYLSKVLVDDYTPIGIAKALYFPRILGTSINTSFGTRIQSMFVVLGLAEGSLIKGMDIEFVDQTDKRKKWCQLKSGPNTINAEDVPPLIKKFTNVTNLARTNNMAMNNSDLIVGVLYGSKDQISQHYKKIDTQFPVIIGQDFWHRITGYPDFYSNLVVKLDQLIFSLDTEDFLKQGYLMLAKEIESSDLFDFS